jgi:hypothetical protein
LEVTASLSDIVSLAGRVSKIDVSPQFDNYSKVVIHVSDDTTYVAGNDTGRTLEIDNPFGTQAMAERMLQSLTGYQYQPYEAQGALLDPAAEIGDAVGTASSYGGLYTRSREFGRLMKADISAPHDEEINHEYKFESPQERKFARQINDVKASLIITNDRIQSEVTARQNADNAMSSRITQNANSITAEVTRAKSAEGTLSTRITQTANSITAEVSRAKAEEGNLRSSLSIQASEIAAKVSASGGRNASGSFSWTLNSTGHRWFANGSSTPIMEITASGLTVRGKGIFDSGKIGGFEIDSSSLRYNGLNYGDENQEIGAYIGTRGLQLGKKFRVDMAGSVVADSMSLLGTLWFRDSDGRWWSMNADNLRQGAQQSYNNYGSWNGTTSAVNSNGSYWSGGAGAGYTSQSYWNSARSNYGIDWLSCRRFTLSGYDMGRQTINYKDHNGNNRTITVATFQ